MKFFDPTGQGADGVFQRHQPHLDFGGIVVLGQLGLSRDNRRPGRQIGAELACQQRHLDLGGRQALIDAGSGFGGGGPGSTQHRHGDGQCLGAVAAVLTSANLAHDREGWPSIPAKM